MFWTFWALEIQFLYEILKIQVFKCYTLELVCLVNYLWIWSTLLLWPTYLTLFYYSVPFKWVLQYRASLVLVVLLMVNSPLSPSILCCVISWNSKSKKGVCFRGNQWTHKLVFLSVFHDAWYGEWGGRHLSPLIKKDYYI